MHSWYFCLGTEGSGTLQKELFPASFFQFTRLQLKYPDTWFKGTFLTYLAKKKRISNISILVQISRNFHAFYKVTHILLMCRIKLFGYYKAKN